MVAAAGASPLTPSAVAPALKYYSMPGYDFYPYRSTTAGYDFANGTWPTGGVHYFLKSGVRIPDGSILRQVTVYAKNNDAPMSYILQRNPLVSGGFGATILAFGSETLLPGAQTQASTTLAHVVDNSTHSYSLQVGFTSATGLQEMYGARVAYEPANAVSALSSSARVLDTRSGSKIDDGDEVTIDLSTRLPAGSRFAICTVTIDQTELSGYLAAFAADGAWPGNSNINWAFDDESSASTVIVPLSAARQFKIRGGGGRTHVIVDVTGAIA